MTVSDKAIAQAFREARKQFVGWPVQARALQAILRRARELDAEKGGEITGVSAGSAGTTFFRTPPAQAAEAVERVDRVAKSLRAFFADCDVSHVERLWEQFSDKQREHFRAMARAAIAAMQAGD